MWTGDNLGTWEHMAVGIKMVLANNLAGMSFSGCKHIYFVTSTMLNPQRFPLRS